jgi:putative transposase
MINSQLFSKVWIHTIIGVKNKLPIILPEYEPKIYTILTDCFKNQGCIVDEMNGTADHIHVIYQLNIQKSMGEVLTEVCLESKQLINSSLYSANSFDWADTSASFSISSSQINKVTEYLKNQKELHKTKSFQKEFDEFLQVHGIKI